MRTKKIVFGLLKIKGENYMKHYIIVKFNEDYNYLKQLEDIQKLFNEALTINGINKIDIYQSNSNKVNRHDLMIKMDLTNESLVEFDNSWIHTKWKSEYGKYIQSKTIFDCE
jgi:hypothetical protein